MRIGFVTFGLPPEYNRKVSGSPGPAMIEPLLGDRGHEFVRFHVHTAEELAEAISGLGSQSVHSLIVVLSQWTRIALVVNLVRSAGVPAALYARTTGGFNGVTALTAASAGLRELTYSRSSDLHARFKEGMEEELLIWVDAVAAYAYMRGSRLMCWGGAYGANMPYTRSDPAWLESRLVAEVMTEQEIVLTDKADRIMAGELSKTDAFLGWAQSNGLQIDYQDNMCTHESVRRQTALYLAARERLSELGGENIRGVSLKCHFELSTTHWGCTGCMMPAFLPFPEGPDGSQAVIPMACEGDLDGLVGLLMLHALNPDVPPLFGDFVEYNDEFVLLRNCGSSSVYWAGASNDPATALSRTRLVPNMHGKSGAAVSYETPEIDSVTMCRLFRLRGEFHVIAAPGRVLAETADSRYPDPWPHTRIQFPFDSNLLFQAYPCNHSSLTRGNLTAQLEWICRIAGIPCHILNSNADLQRFIGHLQGA